MPDTFERVSGESLAKDCFVLNSLARLFTAQAMRNGTSGRFGP